METITFKNAAIISLSCFTAVIIADGLLKAANRERMRRGGSLFNPRCTPYPGNPPKAAVPQPGAPQPQATPQAAANGSGMCVNNTGGLYTGETYSNMYQ